jgi:hypothetical protein
LIGTAIATVPAATLYAYNSQFPDFFEIADYERENNFILMTGKKDVPYYKIPKGEVGRIFGNPVENFMGYLKNEDQKSFAEMTKDLLFSLSPVQGLGDVIPTAFSVPLQTATNYDTFRKQNIVSPYQKDLPAEAQFNKTTSETSKWIGDKLKISPAKIDFVLKGFGAGVAKQGLQLTDATLFGKAPDTADLPVIDRFLGEQSDLNKTATKIYEEEDKRKQEVARKNFGAKQKIEEYLKTGNEQLLEQAIEANPDSFKQFFNDAVERQEKEGMSPTEKAILSLPKNRQEEVRSDLGLTTTDKVSGINLTGKPTKAQLQLKNMKFEKENGEYAVVTNKYSLQADRLKDAKDTKGWLEATDKQLTYLEGYIKTLDPESAEYFSKVKTYENLVQTYEKYAGYGGFTKPKAGKKAKKLTLKEFKPAKISTSTFEAPQVKKISLNLKPYSNSNVSTKFAKLKLGTGRKKSIAIRKASSKRNIMGV